MARHYLYYVEFCSGVYAGQRVMKNTRQEAREFRRSLRCVVPSTTPRTKILRSSVGSGADLVPVR